MKSLKKTVVKTNLRKDDATLFLCWPNCRTAVAGLDLGRLKRTYLRENWTHVAKEASLHSSPLELLRIRNSNIETVTDDFAWYVSDS